MCAEAMQAETPASKGRMMPPDPPRCPPGWVTAPPDFVGVGVQRSGTTWWYALIASHPQVKTTADKEVHFFDALGDVGHADPDAYARYFPRPPGELSGEWTPEYMFHFETPALLASAAADARLLVILRDPIERYLSGLIFLDWLHRHNPARPDRQVLVAHALERGMYSSQLTNLLRHFRRSQLLVLQYEHCVAEPHRELRRTFDFLGVDPDMTRPDVRERFHATGECLRMDPAERATLVTYFEPEVRSLLATFPEIDATLWRNFAHLA